MALYDTFKILNLVRYEMFLCLALSEIAQHAIFISYFSNFSITLIYEGNRITFKMCF